MMGRPSRWAPILLLIVGWAAHFNGVYGTFVFDDSNRILDNPRIQQVNWETVSGRRPVVDLTLAMNYAAAGTGRPLSPRGFHVVNLAIHLLASLTLFGLVRRTLCLDAVGESFREASTPLALVIAAIWVVHPLQTGSVTYLIQRAESIMGLFYLLTLYLFLRGACSNSGLFWFVAAVACSALGMCSKAVMITAPVTVLIFDLLLVSRGLSVAMRRRWGLYAGLAATWFLLLATDVAPGVLSTGRSGATVGFSVKGIAPIEYLLTQAGVLTHYLSLTFWPRPLCLDHGWPTASGVNGVLLPLLVVLAALGGTAWAVARKSALGLAGAWFFIILAPTSSVVPIKDAMFEHRMYLPLAGVVCIAVAAGFAGLGYLAVRLTWSHATRRGAGVAIATAVILALGVGTMLRNRDYLSEFGMWQDVLTKRPENARAHMGFGTALFARAMQSPDGKASTRARGLFGRAEASFRRCVVLRPRFPDGHYNLGNALAELGRLDEAVVAYREAVRLKPSYTKAHYNLGNALKRQNRLTEAVVSYQAAISLQRGHISARTNLGSTLKLLGRIDEAIQQYQRVLKLDPRHANAHFHLGDAYRMKGRLDDAVRQFEAALASKPGHASATRLLAQVRAEMGS